MRRVCVAAAALLTAACAGVPTGGAVHLGRELPPVQKLDDLDVRVLPPSWNSGLGPEEVVNDFLRALVNADDDYAIARGYLSAAASGSWQATSGVTTYDETGVREVQQENVSTSRVTVQLRAPRVGRIDARGEYTPAGGTLTETFSVVQQGRTGWRIDRLPAGVVLSATDAQRSFRVADVYYLNRSRSRLVPDQILLQSSQRGVATALVSALLDGPSQWLAPAVRSAVPSGTTLIGNVPVHDNGVADVNLTGSVRLASASDLAAMSAQLVWTLRQVSDVNAVRLLVEGAPLAVPGVATKQPVTAWAKFDPAAPPSTHDVLYVRGGHLAATGGDAAALRRSDPGNVVSAVRSRDGETLAVVQQAAGQMRLFTGTFGAPLHLRLAAASLTPPTYGASGDVVTVATIGAGRDVLAVGADGAVRRVPADAALLAHPVQALQVSRDGARVAAVTSTGKLLVGRVEGNPGEESLSGFRDITGGFADIHGLAWADADQIAMTTSSGSGSRQVVLTDPVGYSARIVGVDGVRGSAVDVAALPGEPLLIGTDAGVIYADVEGWRQLAVGTAPAHSG